MATGDISHRMAGAAIIREKERGWEREREREG
jgi:hypothetical protein